MQMIKYFLKNFNFFAHKKLKKPPSKVAQNSSNPVFFPYTALTAQTEEFLFQNVAYWLTGVESSKLSLDKKYKSLVCIKAIR